MKNLKLKRKLSIFLIICMLLQSISISFGENISQNEKETTTEQAITTEQTVTTEQETVIAEETSSIEESSIDVENEVLVEEKENATTNKNILATESECEEEENENEEYYESDEEDYEDEPEIDKTIATESEFSDDVENEEEKLENEEELESEDEENIDVIATDSDLIENELEIEEKENEQISTESEIEIEKDIEKEIFTATSSFVEKENLFFQFANIKEGLVEESENEIILKENIVIDMPLYISDNEILELNGYTITANNSQVFVINNAGLTLKNGKIIAATGSEAISGENADIIIDGAEIYGGNGQNNVIGKGGDGKAAIYINYTNNNHSINFKNGKIIGGNGGDGVGNYIGREGAGLKINNRELGVDTLSSGDAILIYRGNDGDFGGGNGGAAIYVTGDNNVAKVISFESNGIVGGNGGKSLNFNETKILYSSSTLPSYYDARRENIVTSVKNQGTTGTCWAFAETSQAETYMLKYHKNFLKTLGYNSQKEFDLSEMALSYYISNPPADPLGNVYDNGIHQLTNTGYLFMGRADYGAQYLSAYGFDDDTNFKYAPEFRKIAADNESNGVAEDGNKYLTNDYNKVDEAIRSIVARPDSRKPIIRLTGGRAINRNTFVGIDGDANFHKAMKEYIYKYGSVIIAMYIRGTLGGTANGEKVITYTDKYGHTEEYTACYNITPDVSSGHELVAVGWDDDFPKENFPDYGALTMDGALLVKNSWGEDDHYYWIPYEYPITEGKHFFAYYTYEPITEENENMYFYDGGVLCGKQMVANSVTGGKDKASIANIFRINGKEKINSISYFNYDTCSIVGDINIYKSNVYNNGSLMLYGDKIWSKTIDASNPILPGYNTIKIDEELIVNPGDYIAVALQDASSIGRYGLCASFDDGETSPVYYPSPCAGKSYWNFGYDPYWDLVTNANFCIRMTTETLRKYDIEWDDNNGNTGTLISVSNKYPAQHLASKNVNPVRSGYTFVEWNDDKNGDGKTYDLNTKYISTDALKLYAIWSKDETVRFELYQSGGSNKKIIDKEITITEVERKRDIVDLAKKIYSDTIKTYGRRKIELSDDLFNEWTIIGSTTKTYNDMHMSISDTRINGITTIKVYVDAYELKFDGLKDDDGNELVWFIPSNTDYIRISNELFQKYTFNATNNNIDYLIIDGAPYRLNQKVMLKNLSNKNIVVTLGNRNETIKLSVAYGTEKKVLFSTSIKYEDYKNENLFNLQKIVIKKYCDTFGTYTDTQLETEGLFNTVNAYEIYNCDYSQTINASNTMSTVLMSERTYDTQLLKEIRFIYSGFTNNITFNHNGSGYRIKMLPNVVDEYAMTREDLEALPYGTDTWGDGTNDVVGYPKYYNVGSKVANNSILNSVANAEKIIEVIVEADTLSKDIYGSDLVYTNVNKYLWTSSGDNAIYYRNQLLTSNKYTSLGIKSGIIENKDINAMNHEGIFVSDLFTNALPGKINKFYADAMIVKNVKVPVKLYDKHNVKIMEATFSSADYQTSFTTKTFGEVSTDIANMYSGANYNMTNKIATSIKLNNSINIIKENVLYDFMTYVRNDNINCNELIMTFDVQDVNYVDPNPGGGTGGGTGGGGGGGGGGNIGGGTIKLKENPLEEAAKKNQGQVPGEDTVYGTKNVLAETALTNLKSEETINGTAYSTQEGEKVVGLKKVKVDESTNIYYFDEHSVIYCGWMKDENNDFRYFDGAGSGGTMVTEPITIDGKTYTFNSTGELQQQDLDIDTKVEILNKCAINLNKGDVSYNPIANTWNVTVVNPITNEKELATGYITLVQKEGVRSYYYDVNGIMQTGWQNVNGREMYFDPLVGGYCTEKK